MFLRGSTWHAGVIGIPEGLRAEAGADHVSRMVGRRTKIAGFILAFLDPGPVKEREREHCPARQVVSSGIPPWWGSTCPMLTTYQYLFLCAADRTPVRREPTHVPCSPHIMSRRLTTRHEIALSNPLLDENPGVFTDVTGWRANRRRPCCVLAAREGWKKPVSPS